jgi:calmodulin
MLRLSEQEICDFQSAFQLFDINRDGSVTVSEFGIGLRNVGQNPTEAELQQMIHELDTNNGTIDCNELLELVMKNAGGTDPPSENRGIFKILDRKEQGFLTIEDIHHFVKCVGLPISEQDIVLMIREVDLDGDNMISIEEFYQLCNSIVGQNIIDENH